MLSAIKRNVCVGLLVLVLVFLTGCYRSVSDAARKGDLKAVKRSFAFNKDSIDAHRHFALCGASSSGQTEIVRFILEDTKNNRNSRFQLSLNRAFIIASQNGQAHIIKILLENGADINARGLGENGKTALYMATVKGQKEAVKTLLDNGADVNGRNKMGH